MTLSPPPNRKPSKKSSYDVNWSQFACQYPDGWRSREQGVIVILHPRLSLVHDTSDDREEAERQEVEREAAERGGRSSE